MSFDNVQFVEVSQIIIRNSDRQRKFWSGGGDYRITIKHDHGTEETIPCSGSGPEVTVDFKTFVQLNAETTIQVHRAKKISRNTDPNGPLKITGEEGENHTIDLVGEPAMSVTLKLVQQMTMTQVVETRVGDANEILEKETQSAKELDRVTGHMENLVGVLEVVSKFDPFSFTEGAVSIAKMVFKQAEAIPVEYKALKDVALECTEQIRFDEDARKTFTTERIRTRLGAVMKLVLQVLELIFAHYSQPPIRRLTGKLAAPSGSTIKKVEDLASDLRKQRDLIDRDFLLAIVDGQQKSSNQLNRIEQAVAELQAPKLTQEKEGWAFLDDTSESDPLKRFLGTIRPSRGKDPCLQNTRVCILAKLSSWAQDGSTEASRLFWLYGIAGCGKSAVAVSTSKALADVRRLAGSFFCKRDEATRRNPVQLFGHLSSCLADKCSMFKQALVESLDKYRYLDSKDKSTFFEYALLEPLSRAADYAPSTPFIFLIDALDECNDSGTVAGFLAEIVTKASWIKLIVTSREEPAIKRAFSKSGVPRAEHNLFDDDVQSDVLQYLHNQLHPFPDLIDCIDDLARKSGALFIWLHTVMEAIMNSKAGRKQKIQAFLDQPLSGDSEGKMAETYLTVLKQASGYSELDISIIKMIVGLLLVTSITAPLTISGMYAFLPPSLAKDMSLNEFSDLIMELKPVLKLTPISDGSDATAADEYRLLVQTHHASFLDFCAKKNIPFKTDGGSEATRSNPFWTDPVELHRNMAMGCLEVMKKGKRVGDPTEAPFGLRFNICGLETSHKLNSEVDDLKERIATRISSHLIYSSLYWAKHLLQSSLDEGTLEEKTSITSAVSDFLGSTLSLFWLEILSLTGNLPAGREALVGMAMETKTKALIQFSRIESETSFFIEQCFSAISASAPHLYLSLAWLPVDSQLWTAWKLKTEFSGTSVLEVPIQQSQSTRCMSSMPFPVRMDTFAVSPDNKHIVSGSSDGYVRLWSLGSTDKPVTERLIALDAAPIGALVYTPSGSHLLCVCNGVVYTLNKDTLRPIGEGRVIPHRDVRCMAASEVRIAFGKEDGRVVVLDSKRYHDIWSGQSNHAVDAIAFSPDGTRLVYAANYVYIRIWDKTNRSYKHSNQSLRVTGAIALAFSSDGKNIATSVWSGIGSVQLFDLESGEEIGRFDVNSPVQFLTFSRGNHVITATASKEKYSSSSEDLQLRLEGSRHYIVDNYNYHWWAEETSLQIWNVTFSRGQQTQSASHTDAVRSVTFSPDGKKIVSGSSDGSVRVWNAETGQPEKLAEMMHSNRVCFVTFSPDGAFVASGGLDNVIRIWDVQTGGPVRVLEGHTDWIRCGAYSPDGSRFVSGSHDKTLRLWDVQLKNRPRLHRRFFRLSNKPVSDQEDTVFSGHEDAVTSAAFLPDGSCIASASEDSTIRFWDAKTRRPIGDPLLGHYDPVISIALSLDGSRLVSGSSDNTVRIWDTRTRTAVGEPLRDHIISSVSSVAYSPDGNFIFSASLDDTIRCWSMATGNPVGHPLKDNSSIYSLAVSPDGSRIVSGSENGAIRVWDSQAFNWEIDRSFAGCGLRDSDRVLDKIPEDGWVRTTEGGLLLWIPVEHRDAVCRLPLLSITQDERERSSIRIMWDRLCHGEKWTDIRTG